MDSSFFEFWQGHCLFQGYHDIQTFITWPGCTDVKACFLFVRSAKAKGNLPARMNKLCAASQTFYVPMYLLMTSLCVSVCLPPPSLLAILLTSVEDMLSYLVFFIEQ